MYKLIASGIPNTGTIFLFYFYFLSIFQKNEDFGENIDFSTFCAAEPENGTAVMCPGYVGSPLVCASGAPDTAGEMVLAGFQSYTYMCDTPGILYIHSLASPAQLYVPATSHNILQY